MNKNSLILSIITLLIIACTSETKAQYTVKEIKINPTELEMIVGENRQFTATVLPRSTETPKVWWKSSNDKVATVVDGKVTAVASGNATIIVTCQSKRATSQVKVLDKAYPVWKEEGKTGDRYMYLANDKIQIGVDLERGGSIFHCSTAAEKVNHLNYYDEGRFIQQSYYGDDGLQYTWSGSAWTWNPIQGGGSDGQPSKLVSKELTANQITIVTTPRQWGRLASTNSCPLAEDCVMKEIISVKDNYVHLRFRFEYRGSKDLGERAQELPAFFCDWNFKKFVGYNGSAPWTGGALSYITPIPLSGINNENPPANQTENWSAYVNDSGYGIGLYTPGTSFTVYYTAGSGPGGANSGSCSYFAPCRYLHIYPGFVLEYDAYLTIGNIQDIRATFKTLYLSGNQIEKP